MYRLLLAARIGTVFFLITFAILGFIAGVSLTIKLGVVSIILFTFFVDAVVSYTHPQFEMQTPKNLLHANILKLSVLNAPATTQGRKLIMAILVVILFIANLARMLGYFDHAVT